MKLITVLLLALAITGCKKKPESSFPWPEEEVLLKAEADPIDGSKTGRLVQQAPANKFKDIGAIGIVTGRRTTCYGGMYKIDSTNRNVSYWLFMKIAGDGENVRPQDIQIASAEQPHVRQTNGLWIVEFPNPPDAIKDRLAKMGVSLDSLLFGEDKTNEGFINMTIDGTEYETHHKPDANGRQTWSPSAPVKKTP